MREGEKKGEEGESVFLVNRMKHTATARAVEKDSKIKEERKERRSTEEGANDDPWSSTQIAFLPPHSFAPLSSCLHCLFLINFRNLKRNITQKPSNFFFSSFVAPDFDQ